MDYEELMKTKNIILRTDKIDFRAEEESDGSYYHDCININVKDIKMMKINDNHYVYEKNISQTISCDIIDNIYVYSNIKIECFFRLGCHRYEIDTFGEFIFMPYHDLFLEIIFLEKPKINDSVKITFRSCYIKEDFKKKIICNKILSNNKVYMGGMCGKREDSQYRDDSVIYYNKFINDLRINNTISILNDAPNFLAYNASKFLTENNDCDAVLLNHNLHFAIINIDCLEKNDKDQYYIDIPLSVDIYIHDKFSIVKTTRQIKCFVKIGDCDFDICDVNEIITNMSYYVAKKITIVFLEKPKYGDEVHIRFNMYVLHPTFRKMLSDKKIISKNKIYTKEKVEKIYSRTILISPPNIKNNTKYNYIFVFSAVFALILTYFVT